MSEWSRLQNLAPVQDQSFDDPGIRPMHANNVYVLDRSATRETPRLTETSKSAHVLVQRAVSRVHPFAKDEKV